MKGTSKLIMGATLVMVVSLAIVLGLILVLLAELYCSLLLRRRKLRNTHSNTTTTTTTTTIATATSSSPSLAPPHPPLQNFPPPPPFSSIYSQGVLQAPRSFIFPCMEQDMAEQKKQHQQQHSELHHVIHVQTQESNASPHGIGLVSVSSSSPLSSFLSMAPQKPVQEELLKGSEGEIPCPDNSPSCGGGGGGEHLVYISNPIYENEEGKASGVNTPFETPNTSPSHLERSGSSGEDDNDNDVAELSPCGAHSPPYTPPLTPMKKLPAEACSVSLRDARSLGTSASDSRSINGLSSSSSGSPCTSPSW